MQSSNGTKCPMCGAAVDIGTEMCGSCGETLAPGNDGKVVVPPGVQRLLLAFLVGGLGMFVGIVGNVRIIFGPGQFLTTVAAGVGGLIVLAFVVAVVRRRPRLVITPEGFTIYKLFGAHLEKWQDVHGQFAAITIGVFKVVGYNLTTEHKVRIGKKPTSLFSGYDAAISGAFALSAEKLAELLNAYVRRDSGLAAVSAGDIDKPA